MRDLFASVRGVTCNTKAEWIWSTKAYTGLVESLFIPIGNGVEKSSPALEPSQGLPKNDRREALYRFYRTNDSRERSRFSLKCLPGFSEKGSRRPPLVLVGEGPMAADPRIAHNKSIVSLGWLTASLKTSCFGMHWPWSI